MGVAFYKNMKKLIFVAVFLGLIVPMFSFAAVWVNGYYRSNGTYVSGHYRSNPDGNPYNNYSYPGNTNPYTGKVAPGNSSTYLNNYYNNSSYSLPSYTPPSYSLPSYSDTAPSSGSSYEKVSGGYKYYGVLFCNSGYKEKDGECTKPYGGSYIGSRLSCDDGFVEYKNKCLQPKTYCKAKYGDNATSKDNKCVCRAGFYYNDSTCEKITDSYCKNSFGQNSWYDVTKQDCVLCKTGVRNGDGCLDYTANCQKYFGPGSYGSEAGCYCSSNYKWNADKTACINK